MFTFGDGIKTPAGPRPYRHKPGDPVTRPLHVYALDPGASRFEGAMATIQVPWEPLEPGPSGAIFTVRDFHKPSGVTFAPIDLNSHEMLLGSGLTPTTTNPAFAQQMTYAVAMATYERFLVALGRLPEFAPGVRRGGKGRLEIRPHFDAEDNAYYDPDLCSLCFGYVKASEDSIGRLQKDSFVFTCLSHDVIVHETAHALLDGMRPLLMLPSNPDVAAFHEGFSDLIALLMRFRYQEIVRRAFQDSGGSLGSKLLTELAREWGRAGGSGRAALRELILRNGPPDGDVPKADRYDRKKEHHDLGGVLVAAVFEAMRRVFERKTQPLRRIAALSPAAQDQVLDLLAKELRDVAGQFLSIIIRAVDYCPPIDITLGEFLRALITADSVTVPADPLGYREALVLAFRRYGITVPGVPDLSEDALLWRSPEKKLPNIDKLSFRQLRHGCEPGWYPDEKARYEQADALGKFVTASGRASEFGLVPTRGRKADEYALPVIQSVRTLRRLTPAGELDFHVVAEITQRRVRNGRSFYGGSTVILDEEGTVRFVIRKAVDHDGRRADTDTFLKEAPAAYRAAFSGDSSNTGTLMRKFHAPGGRRKR
jgi:hypothetical protein